MVRVCVCVRIYRANVPRYRMINFSIYIYNLFEFILIVSLSLQFITETC
jgi:hypothetical protein